MSEVLSQMTVYTTRKPTGTCLKSVSQLCRQAIATPLRATTVFALCTDWPPRGLQICNNY